LENTVPVRITPGFRLGLKMTTSISVVSTKNAGCEKVTEEVGTKEQGIRNKLQKRFES